MFRMFIAYVFCFNRSNRENKQTQNIKSIKIQFFMGLFICINVYGDAYNNQLQKVKQYDHMMYMLYTFS